MPISRKIHQVWVGGEIPERERNWCELMARMNPTWEHRLWRNELIERYASDPYVRALQDQQKPLAFLSDRLRVLLLRDEGGIYLDADCQPMRPLATLDRIWTDPAIEFVFGLRSPHRPGVALHRGISLADNTMIASAPNSRLIRRIEALWSPKNIVIDGHATGAEVLANLDGYSDSLLGYRYFYDLDNNPSAIVLHDAFNLSSWVEDTKVEQRARFAKV